MGDASLAGWVVGVTADRRAEEQMELLQRAGARVLHGPAIRTQPLGPQEVTRAALLEVLAEPPDAVVLTTGVGTRAVFEVAETLGLADELLAAVAPADLFVRGPKACGAANTIGLTVRWQAPTATSRELVAHLADWGVAGKRIAVQLDGRAEPVLGDALRALGAKVVDIPVYRWTLPDDHGPADRLITAVCDHRLDAVTFTSSPALWNFIELAEPNREALLAALNGPVACVSIGEVCTESGRAFGIERIVQPERHRLGAMVRAIARHAREIDDEFVVDIAGTGVVLHASTVVVDGAVIDLSQRERAVLAALLERPGVVVGKEELLSKVWSRSTDAHVAEATVSRLRRRLDGRLRVRVVPQRGYVLTAA